MICVIRYGNGAFRCGRSEMYSKVLVHVPCAACPFMYIHTHTGNINPIQKKSGLVSGRTAYRELLHLLQHGFDLSVQLTGGVIVPDRVVEVPLNVAKLLVSLFSELALHADHGFERRIKVGDP